MLQPTTACSNAAYTDIGIRHGVACTLRRLCATDVARPLRPVKRASPVAMSVLCRRSAAPEHEPFLPRRHLHHQRVRREWHIHLSAQASAIVITVFVSLLTVAARGCSQAGEQDILNHRNSAPAPLSRLEERVPDEEQQLLLQARRGLPLVLEERLVARDAQASLLEDRLDRRWRYPLRDGCRRYSRASAVCGREVCPASAAAGCGLGPEHRPPRCLTCQKPSSSALSATPPCRSAGSAVRQTTFTESELNDHVTMLFARK